MSTEDTIAALDRGEIRVAEKVDGEWQVNADAKAAILDYFRIREMEAIVLALDDLTAAECEVLHDVTRVGNHLLLFFLDLRLRRTHGHRARGVRRRGLRGGGFRRRRLAILVVSRRRRWRGRSRRRGRLRRLRDDAPINGDVVAVHHHAVIDGESGGSGQLVERSRDRDSAPAPPDACVEECSSHFLRGPEATRRGGPPRRCSS